MASRYIVTTNLLSSHDRKALINEIDKYAFLFSENAIEGYIDITWDLKEDISNIIKFPTNCHVEKVG